MEITGTNSMPREYVNQEDLTKAARKVGEAKKHESKLLYISPAIYVVHIFPCLSAKMEYSA
jgi:hypothetical protein